MEQDILGLEMAAISSPSWKSSPSQSQQLCSPSFRSSVKARASAFAKRSQSFCDRGFGVAAPLTGWGSPDGKLDWGIQGDELGKLRKSVSFGIRGRVNAESTLPTIVDEPDVSWVQSLVKDCPPVGRESFSTWFDQVYYEQEQMVA